MKGRTAGLFVAVGVAAAVGGAGLPAASHAQEAPAADVRTDAHPAAESPPAAAEVEIREWDVPWENSRPRDPYVGPDGRVWFVGQRGNYVAYLEPESGEFRKYDMNPGTFPHNLIVDEDGTVWYAGNRDRHIGKLEPATGEITEYPMPNPEARDPHTLVFDGRGHIWFTVQGGNFVGRFDMGTGESELIEVPTPGARPYGIRVDEAGRPWFTLFGTYKIGTVDPATMELEEIPLPREDARPRRLAFTPDGTLWYVDYARGYVGRMDPATREFREWRAPGREGARPYGMMTDADGRVWFVETGPDPNRFVGFDPEAEEFFSVTDIPSGGGTVRHMYYHAPADEIWFGADTNTVGRVKLP